MYTAKIHLSTNETVTVDYVDTIQYYGSNSSISTIKIADFLKKPIYIKLYLSIFGEKDLIHFNKNNQPLAVEFHLK